MQPLFLWQTQKNLQPSIKITISLTKNFKGILKRCIQSESRTKQCLQEEKPGCEHLRVKDPLNPHPSPANHTGNRTGLNSLLQTAEFEAALLQLVILKGKLVSGKPSLLHRSGSRAHTALQGPGDPAASSGRRGDVAAARGPGKALAFKEGVHFSSRLVFHTQIGGASWRREDWMPSDGWGCEHIGNLAVPMRAVKAGTVSHLLCFGDFKHWRNHKITSGLTLTMMTLFHPRAKPNVQFSSLFWNSTFRTLVEVRRMIYRLSKSKFGEKQELYWKGAFLGKSSHLHNINII